MKMIFFIAKKYIFIYLFKYTMECSLAAVYPLVQTETNKADNVIHTKEKHVWLRCSHVEPFLIKQVGKFHVSFS